MHIHKVHVVNDNNQAWLMLFLSKLPSQLIYLICDFMHMHGSVLF